jgi:hypothetical protein
MENNAQYEIYVGDLFSMSGRKLGYPMCISGFKLQDNAIIDARQ